VSRATVSLALRADNFVLDPLIFPKFKVEATARRLQRRVSKSSITESVKRRAEIKALPTFTISYALAA